MKSRLAGWILIVMSICCFSIHLPIFAAAAHVGNIVPGFPMGYIAIASVVAPLGLGAWLVLWRQ